MPRMDRAMFTKLAETAHRQAETNMRQDGHVLPVVLLFDRYAEMSVCAMAGDLDDHMLSQMRRAARAIDAVAAIRISEGMSLRLPPGADQLSYDDLPVPSESPDAQRQIISEARWPRAALHQVRATNVGQAPDGALTLLREEGDPDQAVMRNDLLAKLFPPQRSSRSSRRS